VKDTVLFPFSTESNSVNYAYIIASETLKIFCFP
jgi:hypothetical protein